MLLRRFCVAGMLLLGTCFAATPAPVTGATAVPLAGRWEGSIQTSGSPVPIVLDIDKAEAGEWVGSAIFPGFGVKGAPLKSMSVEGSSIVCTVKSAMGEPKISAELTTDGTLSGKYEQGGNTLQLSLKKVGAAQVDFPRLSTPISKELEGDWQGLLVIGPFKMRLALNLANAEKGPAAGKLIMLDSGNYTSTVDLIVQDGDNLEFSSPAVNFGYEGRFDKAGGELRGVIRVNSLELPLNWHRPAKDK